MKISISQKLSGAFLGLTVIVLVATLGLARWSFERGFLDYVNALEMVRLESLKGDFEAEYQALGGDWSLLTVQRFNELITHPGPTKPMNTRRPRPPHMDDSDSGPPPHLAHRDAKPYPPKRPPLNRVPTALFDLNNVKIMGAKMTIDGVITTSLPIIVDGTKVAELRSAPRRYLTSPQETAFAAQQLRASWIIGLLCLAFALVCSLLLAKGLLAPVRRMISDVKRLSNGDYSVRVATGRSDELGQLQEDVDALAHNLEQARSSRQEWLANVSHELRTPVSILSGELEALQDGLRSFDLKGVNSLHQEVQRLSILINDLYDLSLSDAGGLRYNFTEVNLADIIHSAVDSMAPRAKIANIGFAIETKPVVVSADANRINQLMTNLLENSLAYTDPNGRIALTLSVTPGTAIIHINDTPPGVTSSECDQLFNAFYRLETSRSRRTGGAGLGLAICQKIIDAHKGKIKAAPSAIGGLCITIELPIKQGG